MKKLILLLAFVGITANANWFTDTASKAKDAITGTSLGKKFLTCPDCKVVCNDGSEHNVTQYGSAVKLGTDCHSADDINVEGEKLCAASGGLKSSNCKGWIEGVAKPAIAQIPDLVKKYGPQAAELVTKYGGPKATAALDKYGPKAAEMLAKGAAL